MRVVITPLTQASRNSTKFIFTDFIKNHHAQNQNPSKSQKLLLFFVLYVYKTHLNFLDEHVVQKMQLILE